jgi:Flp pilus assembly protein TadG
MTSCSVLKRLVRKASTFVKADSGNVAMIMAAAALPLLFAVGAAIDYTRVVTARSKMQAAIDAAALMLAQDAPSLSASQLTTRAQAYFTAMYQDTHVTGVSVQATYTANTGAGSTIAMTATGNLPMNIMQLAGYNQVALNTSTTATWGNTKMRVAMVLDNTGSMASSGKMTALQNAAKNLIDQLSATAQNAGDVYISVVPFSRDVNVDTSNYTQNWVRYLSSPVQNIDWQAEPGVLQSSKPSGWSNVGPGSSCPFSTSTQGFRCTVSPVNGSSNTSTIPSSGTYAGYICPGQDSNSGSYHNGCYNSVPTTTSNTVCSGSGSCSCGTTSNCSCTGTGNSKVCTQTTSGPPYTHNWIANNTNTWNGCVTDRDQDYDIASTAASTSTAGTLYPAEQYSMCPVSMVGLSYDWTSLKSKIDSMTPNGNTNQAIGLAWGWQTLLQTSPFPAPAENVNYNYIKAIILLSDGLNTQNRWTTTQSTIDTRQATLCTAVKQAGVILYTIQVNTSGDPTSTVLQNCASSSDKFFMLTSSTQVLTAFNTISTQLKKLRISQ